MLKRTAFYEKHREAGGKIVPFAGFEMPIQYKGIIQEVKQVRAKVGMFDVSHMGRVKVRGAQAVEFISKITVNDPSKLEISQPEGCGYLLQQAQYSCMCYPNGGIVDDIVVYRQADSGSEILRSAQNDRREQNDRWRQADKFLIVINAANKDKDWGWMIEHKIEGVEIIDVSDEIAQLAIQGPEAESVLEPLVDIDLGKIKFYWGANCKIAGIPAFISRTGYTGEDGFEIYFDSKHPEIWDKILEIGAKPVGLGARDVLRLEMKYCLYGNDIDKNTTPLEAGLGWITKLDKPDFIGKDVLVKQKEEGVKRKLVAFIMEGMRVIPRQHYKIYSPQSTVHGPQSLLIGEVTSGNYSPSIDRLIGLGYVNASYSEIETRIEIECRSKLERAKIIKPPFYKDGTRK